MDFFFGPVLICTISSNISNDSTQLKFSFNIFFVENMSAIPACRGLIAVSLLPLAAWWAPNRSVHPCFQGNSNLSALDTSRSRATLCKWPFPDRKASISDGARFLCLWCLIKLYTDANLFVASPWEVEPNQCTEAGQVVYGILIYYLCAACPKHFVHRATTAHHSTSNIDRRDVFGMKRH